MKYKHILLTIFFAIASLESKAVPEFEDSANRSSYARKSSYYNEELPKQQVTPVKKFVYAHPLLVTGVSMAILTYKFREILPMLNEGSQKLATLCTEHLTEGMEKLAKAASATVTRVVDAGISTIIGALVTETLVIVQELQELKSYLFKLPATAEYIA